MDEAERCHEIAYLAYGKLMARGTTDEIIAQSGLTAWVATGHGADRLAPRLRDAPGVTAAAFGAALHVCGPDAAAVAAAIAPFRGDPRLEWHETLPSVEDVFIHLMGLVRDNAAAA
jgi:ABC-2 type transport system ATP-binding protein